MEKTPVTTDKLQLRFLQKFMGLTDEESDTLMAILTQPTPKEWLAPPRTLRGGKQYRYVPGHRFIQRFNDAFGPLWSFEAPEHFQVGDQLVVKGRWSLTVPGRTITRRYADGTEEIVSYEGLTIKKEQFGSSEVKKYAQDMPERDKKGNPLKDSQGHTLIKYKKGDAVDLGDDYKGCATDAMKKCGTELGFFLDIYGGTDEEDVEGPSDSQLSAFFSRALKAEMEQEAAIRWAEETLGKPFKEATKQDILGLIADLIDYTKKQDNSRLEQLRQEAR
jgi:hypothetical protein